MKVDQCTVGMNKIVITTNGRIVPCESFKFLLDEKIPNRIRPSLKDYSLEFLFRNDPLTRLLRCKLKPLEGWCSKNCKVYSDCGGGCKGQKVIKNKNEFIKFLLEEMDMFYEKYPKNKE